MSRQLANTISMIANGTVMLLAPQNATKLTDDLRMFAQLEKGEEQANHVEHQEQMMATYGHTEYGRDKPFAYADGIAYIPITGLLINRYRYAWSFLTGYNAVREMLQAAIQDDDVKGIVFDVNSGGGQVVGCFELAQEIYESRAVKPSIAIVDAYSYSAAYALSSAASKVVLTPSGEVGSIGAVITHFDYSKLMEDYGVKVSFIFSGKHKVDGNPYEALTQAEVDAMQARVDTARKEFVDLVAKHRGLDTQTVYDTEADGFSADKALALGLVDAVQAPVQAVTAFFTELTSSQTTKEIYMTDKTQAAATAEAGSEQQAQTAAATQTDANALQAARTEERERIKGIQTCAEASNRRTLANHIALNTQLTVEEAVKMLAAAPEEAAPAAAAPAAKNALEAAMEHTGGGAGVVAEGATTEKTMTRAQEILAAQEVATGKKPGAK